jgi:hypothetical protein
MRFNEHSDIEGKHAILSPSYGHWLNYDDQKLFARMNSMRAAQEGTDLHVFAQEAIRLRVRLDPNDRFALAAYVDDAIDLRLQTEVPLYYSPWSFGHADALGFDEPSMTLRTSDLKNGVAPTKFTQLEIYNGLFCLEYDFNPYDLKFINRIYQRDDVREDLPSSDRIAHVMDRIVELDERINVLREEASW